MFLLDFDGQKKTSVDPKEMTYLVSRQTLECLVVWLLSSVYFSFKEENLRREIILLVDSKVHC